MLLASTGHEKQEDTRKKKKQQQHKGWSGAASDQQRSSSTIQPQCPSTACRAQFCLLCCQPEPVPRSLAARMSQLTPRDPCRLHVCMRQAIYIASRTCCGPEHFHTHSSKRQAEAHKELEFTDERGSTTKVPLDIEDFQGMNTSQCQTCNVQHEWAESA